MVIRAGKNNQAQKMGRLVTDERSLILRLFETLIPDWLPLWAGEAFSESPGITIAPCRSWVSSRTPGHAESTIDLRIARLRQIHHGTDSLSWSRSPDATACDETSSWSKIFLWD